MREKRKEKREREKSRKRERKVERNSALALVSAFTNASHRHRLASFVTQENSACSSQDESRRPAAALALLHMIYYPRLITKHNFL